MEEYQPDSSLTFEKVWRMFQETDKKFQETDRQFKETDRQFKETDKKLRKLETLFTSQWGKLIESLVEGDLIKHLQSRKIDVSHTAQRVGGVRNGIQYEFDIIAVNGTDVVIVEVKSNLKIRHIKDFIEELKIAKTLMPEYKNKRILGAVAYLRQDEGADVFAKKQGLFVIKATGSSSSLINSKDFLPKTW